MVQEKVLRKMVQGSKANVHALGLNSSPLKMFISWKKFDPAKISVL
jgi:hypothetical protein